MKKLFKLLSILPLLTVFGCARQNKTVSHHQNLRSSKVISRRSHLPKQIKPDLHKKYPGFKLTTVPVQFRGTWYRGDPYEKGVRKLRITPHLINGSVTYRKINPNLKLDHNSEKQNRKYAGDAVMISASAQKLKARGFLDTVDLVYHLGTFKGQPCLYLSYGTDPQAVNGCIFKNKQVAAKYRKYDFSKVKLPQ